MFGINLALTFYIGLLIQPSVTSQRTYLPEPLYMSSAGRILRRYEVLYPLRLTRGSMVLLFICTLDMLTTLYFVTHGMAVEINPIMDAFFKISPLAFVVAKLVSFVPFVIAIEIYKKHNARFTSLATRFTIAAYSIIYVVATVGANRA